MREMWRRFGTAAMWMAGRLTGPAKVSAWLTGDKPANRGGDQHE